MKKSFRSSVLFLLTIYFLNSSFAQSLPDGFAVWSEGSAEDRTLMLRDLKSDGTMGEPVNIVKKGEKGGDIESQISFDGKWLAFSRSLGARDKYEGDDYHDWQKWEVFVAPLNGKYPVQPIRVGIGYWPSWGEDSDGDTKTLYYTTHEPSTIRKVTINTTGIVAGSDKLVQDIPAELNGIKYAGFGMMAPNGKFMAWRGSAVKLFFFEDWMGQKAGESFAVGKGCHPSITADSRWLIHSQKQVSRVGLKSVSLAWAGNYFYGTSQDLNWFVTGLSSSGANAKKSVTVFPIKIKGESGIKHLDDAGNISSTDFTIPQTGITLSRNGSWPDIHVNASKSTSYYKLTSDFTGKAFQVGDEIEISWEAAGENVFAAMISISPDGGKTWVRILDQAIAISDPMWSKYTWIVQEKVNGIDLVGSEIMIKVEDFPNKTGDKSGQFAIFVDCSPTSVFSVKSPKIDVDLDMSSSHLVIQNGFFESIEVTAFNLFGRKVGEFQVVNKGRSEFEFTENLPNGNYYFRIKSASTSKVIGKNLKK